MVCLGAMIIMFVMVITVAYGYERLFIKHADIYIYIYIYIYGYV